MSTLPPSSRLLAYEKRVRFFHLLEQDATNPRTRCFTSPHPPNLPVHQPTRSAPPGRSPQRTGAIRCPGTFYAPALPLQDLAYSYRVWITLIKLPYAPLRHRRSGPDIHPPE